MLNKFCFRAVGLVAISVLATIVGWNVHLTQIDHQSLGAVYNGFANVEGGTSTNAGRLPLSQNTVSSTLRTYLGVSVQTLNGLLPSQTGNTSTFLTTNGSNASWTTINSTTLGVATFINSKEPLVATGTTGQYYRGDKTWQSLYTGLSTQYIRGDGSLALVSTSTRTWFYVQGVAKTAYAELIVTSTVAGSTGTVIFNLTIGATTTGTPICNTIYSATPYPNVPDPSNNYSFGNYVFSADKRTFNVTANKLGFTSANVLLNLLGALTNVLTGPTYTAVANGTVVGFSIKCE